MSIDLKKLENKLDEALSNETNETLTKFLTNKRMSNNKQSSLDYYITKLTEILGPEIIKQISRDDNERIARLEKRTKATHKEEITQAWKKGDGEFDNVAKQMSLEYYNETFEE